ncbi:MAG: hypothetical protein Q8P41_31670 [Pseudomonadota bacterium]|nr:hypothetical protein [Pseudomonadota bacterium]
MGDISAPTTADYAIHAAYEAKDELRALARRVAVLEAQVRVLIPGRALHFVPADAAAQAPANPFLGRASPAPPVPGKVSFAIERIVPAEDLDGFGRRVVALVTHVDDLAHEVSIGLREEQLGSMPYRIRISIEPEG